MDKRKLKPIKINAIVAIELLIILFLSISELVSKSIIFKLWQKDAIIKIHELKVLICV